jgi:hypothetical protein
LKCFDLFQCSEEMQFCVKENLTSLCSNHSSNCIGSIEDRTYCRQTYPEQFHFRYRCLNDTKCISPDQLCDCQIDCPLKHDDENLLCQYRICQENRYRCRNGKKAERCNRKPECDWKEDESLCDLSDIPNREKYFGLSNEYYQSYPLIEINERKNTHVSKIAAIFVISVTNGVKS